jgi:hypothetical protein
VEHSPTRLAALLAGLLSLIAGLSLNASLAQDMCPGDLDGDANVTVSEIVAVVKAALDGCPASPLTHCPAEFTDTPIAPPPPACEFVGRLGGFCDAPVVASWTWVDDDPILLSIPRSDVHGQQLILTLRNGDDYLRFFVRPESATTGTATFFSGGDNYSGPPIPDVYDVDSEIYDFFEGNPAIINGTPIRELYKRLNIDCIPKFAVEMLDDGSGLEMRAVELEYYCHPDPEVRVDYRPFWESVEMRLTLGGCPVDRLTAGFTQVIGQ